MNTPFRVSYSLLALLALLSPINAISANSERTYTAGRAETDVRPRALAVLLRSGVNALDTMSGILPIWTPILTGLLTSPESSMNYK